MWCTRETEVCIAGKLHDDTCLVIRPRRWQRAAAVLRATARCLGCIPLVPLVVSVQDHLSALVFTASLHCTIVCAVGLLVLADYAGIV